MKKVKGELILLIIVVSVVAILAITNPDKVDYVSWAQERIVKESGDNILAKGLIAIGGDAFINSNSSSTDYVIFSVYETSVLNDKVKVLGILGNFFPITNDTKGTLNSVKNTNSNQVQGGTEAKRYDDIIPEVGPVYDDKEGYWKYHNVRYGFTVNYPGNYLRSNPPSNGDGQQFISPEGTVNIVVSGYNNWDGASLQERCTADLQEHINGIHYKRIGDNWYVLSWISEGLIYYQKAFVGVGSINTMIINYPQNNTYEGNHVVEKMEDSFLPGPLDVSH